VPSISERNFKAVCGVALGSLCVIVFTGALVRLTGSGLGCSDWPQCNETRFVDVSSGHTLIEQANRLFTGVVSFSVIAAVLLAHLRTPKQKRIILLAWGLVVGVLAQIIIGGVVVLTGLNPFANMAHFLVSMVLVANAFILYRRASDTSATPLVRQAPKSVQRLIILLTTSATIAIVTGTVVTATGPHAGDEDAIRLGFTLVSVARVHSLSVIATIALLVFLATKLRHYSEESSLRDAVTSLTVVAVFQAAIGYTQYFTDVPVVLVAAHIIGATSFWIAVCNVFVAPPSVVRVAVDSVS
jgi:cytochrome c oxidase assembly protein subunit 15